MTTTRVGSRGRVRFPLRRRRLDIAYAASASFYALRPRHYARAGDRPLLEEGVDGRVRDLPAQSLPRGRQLRARDVRIRAEDGAGASERAFAEPWALLTRLTTEV